MTNEMTTNVATQNTPAAPWGTLPSQQPAKFPSTWDRIPSPDPQYWLVGASFDNDPQDAQWVREGIWMLGWSEEQQKEQWDRAMNIRHGDRLAIKRMKGPGQTGLRILHLGIVRSGPHRLAEGGLLFVVDWVATDLDRDIAESRGCFATVHGPYTFDDPWVAEVFRI